MLEQNRFCYSQSSKESFLIMVMCYGKKENCTEKEIMQGATSGQRRGRPRTRWQDNTTKWTGLTGDRLLRSVEDRRQWRKIIDEAANPRIEDGAEGPGTACVQVRTSIVSSAR